MSCANCTNSKTIRTCAHCKKELCKNCVLFFEKDEVHLHPKAHLLKFGAYCPSCYDSQVLPIKEEYEKILALSEQLTVVRKSYKGFLPIIRKAKEPFTVKKHKAKNLAIRHLQFLAAWNQYNAIIYLEVDVKKIRNYGFETKEWLATGLFVNLDKDRLRLDDNG